MAAIIVVVIIILICYFVYKHRQNTPSVRPNNYHQTTQYPKTSRRTPYSYTPKHASRGKSKIVFKNVNEAAANSVTEIDLKDVHDAFSGEAIKISLGVFKCITCKVYYHKSSMDVLRSENAGRCVSCLNTNIMPLTTVSSQERGREYTPNIVTLGNYLNFVGHVITFEGNVPTVRTSRDGRSYAVMFENKTWTRGLKMVVFKGKVATVGGSSFLLGLHGKTLRIRGLLAKHHKFGYQIIVNSRSMILEIK